MVPCLTIFLGMVPRESTEVFSTSALCFKSCDRVVVIMRLPDEPDRERQSPEFFGTKLPARPFWVSGPASSLVHHRGKQSWIGGESS